MGKGGLTTGREARDNYLHSAIVPRVPKDLGSAQTQGRKPEARNRVGSSPGSGQPARAGAG